MKTWQKSILLWVAAFFLLTGCSLGGEDKNKKIQSPPLQETENEAPSTNGQVSKKKVALYYPDQDLMELYKTEVEIEIAKEEDAPRKALEVWIKGSEHKQLGNLVPEGVVVQSVKAVNGVAHVSFTKQLQQANLGGAGEQFLMESIALIMKQFGYHSTQILIEGNIVESLLGHVTANVPFEAPDPNQYPSK